MGAMPDQLGPRSLDQTFLEEGGERRKPDRPNQGRSKDYQFCHTPIKVVVYFYANRCVFLSQFGGTYYTPRLSMLWTSDSTTMMPNTLWCQTVKNWSTRLLSKV